MFRSSFTHWNSGRLLWYSPKYGTCDIGKYDWIWFYLILFNLIWLDIPNLTEDNIHYGSWSFLWTADLQATSTFHFIIIFMFKMLLISKKSFEKPRNIGKRILILILILIQILIGKTRKITATIEQSKSMA